jgi:O-antigen/teichoic acid export membrane protein
VTQIKMFNLNQMRRRLLSEYPLSLLSSYLAMAAGITSQVVLVPIYLRTLGAEGFGVLVLMLAMINYAAVGIGWLSGGLQRILGEAFGTKDSAGFGQAIDVGKIIFLAYGSAAALLGIGIAAVLDRSQVPLSAAIVAGVFLVASYESAIERLALTAAARLAAVNLLQFVQVLAYAISVVFVLRAGGGLLGVFACQLGSVLVTRFFLPLCWQGTRPIAKHMIGTLRPLLARLTGRMGGGYFLSAALIVSSQSDVLVIGWLGGAEAAARYVLLWKIAEVGVTALWRISESWGPILVRLDAMEEHVAIKRQYRRVATLLVMTAIPAGLAYALLGPWITMLWLGAEHAPKDQLGFVLAGTAIVWLGLARLPSILSYSLARFRVWNGIAFIEVAARLALTVASYPRFGYLAPLVALNIVHLCGIAAAYQWTGWRLLAGRE